MDSQFNSNDLFRKEIDITFIQNQVQFLNPDCNAYYSFDVYANVLRSSPPIEYITFYCNSVYLFYGSKLKS